MSKLLGLAGVVLLAMLMPVKAHPQGMALRHLKIAGHDRVYTIEAVGPPKIETKPPIIIELHGLGHDVRRPLSSRFFPNFSAVTQMESAILVRPQGANRTWDHLPSGLDDWRRLSGADGVPVDDIAFLRRVIADVVQNDGGDPNNVFVYGISTGGYMTVKIACEMAGEVSAVANLIATARLDQFERCASSKPVPYLLMASKSDPINPYGGFDRGGGSSLLGAEETVRRMASRNGCQTTSQQDLPANTSDPQMTATILAHAGCTENAQVVFIRLDGSDHALPSGVRYASDRSVKINRELETSQVLWDFFKAHMK
jgi:polyhydroxybutyrate depolymerase